MGNIIAIVGFVVIIAIGLWGAIAAVRLAPHLFETIASTFRSSDSSIELSLPASGIRSGEQFVLSWSDAERDSGLYTISYGCTDKLTIDAPISNTEVGPMPCDAPYAIPANESSVRLTPKLAGSARAEFPITITYLSAAGEKQAEGTATIIVTNSAPVETSKAVQPETPETAPTSVPKPAGKPDLHVRLVSVGIIDSYTGRFIPKNTFGSYETIAFKFDVANRGSGKSGMWTFSTYFPTRTGTNYQPGMQEPLGPGDHVEFTLNFNEPMSGAIQISVDPLNVISETDEYNNVLSQYISVAY